MLDHVFRIRVKIMALVEISTMHSVATAHQSLKERDVNLVRKVYLTNSAGMKGEQKKKKAVVGKNTQAQNSDDSLALSIL